jgi:hypothetical protein
LLDIKETDIKVPSLCIYSREKQLTNTQLHHVETTSNQNAIWKALQLFMRISPHIKSNCDLHGTSTFQKQIELSRKSSLEEEKKGILTQSHRAVYILGLFFCCCSQHPGALLAFVPRPTGFVVPGFTSF